MPASGPKVFDIILADGFVLTELAGVVDVLRLANRVTGQVLFQWTYLSRAGGNVTSSSGASVPTDPIAQRSAAAVVYVLGNQDPDHPDLSLLPVVSQYVARQALVVLLAEAAGRYIADRQDQSARHTTHWENRAVLGEKLGLFDTKSALVVRDGSIITCAGMGATVDVTLSLITADLSAAAMLTVTDILLHDRIRHHNTLQPFGGRSAVATGDADLDLCIGVMQDHIEHPLPIAEIAAQTHVSKRSLERKFHRVMKTTPNGFYRELRLNRANNLLLNTDLTIQEIALACGFPGGFTGVYKQTFGMTPNVARKQGRVA